MRLFHSAVVAAFVALSSPCLSSEVYFDHAEAEGALANGSRVRVAVRTKAGRPLEPGETRPLCRSQHAIDPVESIEVWLDGTPLELPQAVIGPINVGSPPFAHIREGPEGFTVVVCRRFVFRDGKFVRVWMPSPELARELSTNRFLLEREAPEEVTPIRVDRFRARGTAEGAGRIEVEVELDGPQSSEAGPADRQARWGASQASQLRALTVSIDGRSVSFPQEAWRDLSDVSKSVSASTREQGDVVLRLRGGDGAETYSVEFVIRDEAVVERVIRGNRPNADGVVVRMIVDTRVFPAQ